MAQAPQTIEQPKSGATPTSGVEARVFSMPERYRHGAQAALHQPETPVAATPVVEVKTPGLPVPPKAPPKAVLPKKKGSATKKILIIGIVVLLGLSVGGYLLLQSVEETTPEPEPTTTSRPAPTTEPEEEPEPDPVVEPEEESEPEVFPVEATPGTDSDSDGLTDIEENLVYDTDPKKPDTDSDGFLDGNEVFHGYNPGGTAPGTLIESGLVELIAGSFNGTRYELFAPRVWDVEVVDEEQVLDAQTGEGFRITFEDGDLPDGDVRTTKQGTDYLLSEDQLTAWLDLGTGLLVIEYDTGIKSKVDYLQTFQMMLNSVTYDSSSIEPVDSQGGTETSTESTPESP